MSNKSKNMQLTLMLPPELVARIDWFASASHRPSRSNAAAVLLRRAIEAMERAEDDEDCPCDTMR
jgi:metal-responsive CopG/Arc/MetJ family transcriptional regulator